MTTDPIVPDHIRAAIHAGHVGQVVIFCDRCGIEETADYTGETREARFAAARQHLADTKGWAITEAQDLCPKCNVPDQPDGIEDDSRDLPDPVVAAERVREYIRANGDGLYSVADDAPLYARDLEALTRVPTKLADVQEELARRTHTLDLVRRELGATREEADRFGAELASANQQISQTKTHFNRRCDTLTARAERAEAERDQLASRLDELIEARIELSEAGHLPPAPVPGSSQHAQEPGERVLLVEIRLAIRQGLMAYPNHLSEGMDAAAVAVARLLDQRAAGESQASEPAQPSAILHDALYRALVDAGILHTGQRVRRIVIDSRAGQPVVVHLERLGDERLLNVVPALDGAEVRESQASEPAAPKLAQGGIIERPIDLDDQPIHTMREVASVAPGHHVGRAWSGHVIEDHCPCPQEPCGLVSTPSLDCDQHKPSRSIRQGHSADRCPGDHRG